MGVCVSELGRGLVATGTEGASRGHAAGTPPPVCQQPPRCTAGEPCGYSRSKDGGEAATPSSARQVADPTRHRLSGRPAGTWGLGAPGPAEPEEEAVARPGQGRRERPRGGRDPEGGTGAGPRADAAVAGRAADGDAPAPSPGAGAADGNGRPSSPPTGHQLTRTTPRTSVCQMGAQVTTVAADTQQQVTGQPLPSMSSQDTCTASHVPRDRRAQRPGSRWRGDPTDTVPTRGQGRPRRP